MNIDLKNKDLLQVNGFINGEWVPSKTNQVFDVINPGNGHKIAEVSELGISDVKDAIYAAQTALDQFKHVSLRSRADLLRAWYYLVLENSEDLAKLISLENGKTYAEALGEVKYSASYLEWYSEEAPRIYGDTISTQNVSNRTYTVKQPIGVCAFITPWNFPAAMITRKVGAAIAAGCPVIIKPSDLTPLTALSLVHLAKKAGISKGMINVITTSRNTKEVGIEFCQNPLIKKISFTGSSTTGKLLMKQCSSSLKKLSLELGGNAPFIVFEDADIELAIQGLLVCKFRGTGQTCVCANRIFVHESLYDEFTKRLIDEVKKFKIGYGLDEGTTHGPVINEGGIDKITSHINSAVKSGAEVAIGGHVLEGLGKTYFEPTVLTNVTPNMIFTYEETFGPIAPLIKFRSDEEVINFANMSSVGLAAYFYTKDISRAHRVAENIETGMIGINVGAISDSAFPFGGIKESGFGKEGSKYGLDEYLIIKSVTVGL